MAITEIWTELAVDLCGTTPAPNGVDTQVSAPKNLANLGDLLPYHAFLTHGQPQAPASLAESCLTAGEGRRDTKHCLSSENYNNNQNHLIAQTQTVIHFVLFSLESSAQAQDLGSKEHNLMSNIRISLPCWLVS